MMESTTQVSLRDLLQLCLNKGLSFVSYREPRGSVKTVIQREGAPQELGVDHEVSEQPGFIISPYRENGTCKRMLIKPDVVVTGDRVDGDVFSEVATFCGGNADAQKCADTMYVCDYEEYVEQVETLVEAITAGRFSKAVLSRVKVVEGSQQETLVSMFLKMCEKYSYSFVYIFQVGEHLWIGATPEILLSMNSDTFRTISLAATRENAPENKNISTWSEKEKQEQQYVTDYISDILSDFEITSAQKGNTYLRRAGHLLHICTEFTCDTKEVKGKLTPLLRALHPTPAVCGMPKEDVRDYVVALEKHDRQYYAGFLGPVNILADQILLYVNLRCVRVLPDHARIHVGGGITVDSVAKDEWAETVLKSKTILSVLQS